MAQKQYIDGTMFADFSQASAPVTNTGLSTLLECPIPIQARVLSVQIKPANNALTNFVVSVKYSRDGAYQVLSNAITTSPSLPITAANATLASLAAGSIGTFYMNVSGVLSVLIQAQCATGADTCDAFAYASP